MFGEEPITVRIVTKKLLDVLKTNRGQHRATFEKALEGYRKQAVAELESMLQEARAGKRIRRAVELVEPIDQTEEYDQVIGMLEMCVDETVTLSQKQYKSYVLDQWDWAAHVGLTNARYT